MHLLINQKDTHRLRKQTYGCHGARDSCGFGRVRYTLLHLKWITNKDLLYSTWNSAQCYVAVWMGEGLGGECMCVCETPSVVSNSLQPHGL